MTREACFKRIAELEADITQYEPLIAKNYKQKQQYLRFMAGIYLEFHHGKITHEEYLGSSQIIQDCTQKLNDVIWQAQDAIASRRAEQEQLVTQISSMTQNQNIPAAAADGQATPEPLEEPFSEKTVSFDRLSIPAAVRVPRSSHIERADVVLATESEAQWRATLEEAQQSFAQTIQNERALRQSLTEEVVMQKKTAAELQQNLIQAQQSLAAEQEQNQKLNTTVTQLKIAQAVCEQTIQNAVKECALHVKMQEELRQALMQTQASLATVEQQNAALSSRIIDLEAKQTDLIKLVRDAQTLLKELPDVVETLITEINSFEEAAKVQHAETKNIFSALNTLLVGQNVFTGQLGMALDIAVFAEESKMFRQLLRGQSSTVLSIDQLQQGTTPGSYTAGSIKIRVNKKGVRVTENDKEIKDSVFAKHDASKQILNQQKFTEKMQQVDQTQQKIISTADTLFKSQPIYSQRITDCLEKLMTLLRRVLIYAAGLDDVIRQHEAQALGSMNQTAQSLRQQLIASQARIDELEQQRAVSSTSSLVMQLPAAPFAPPPPPPPLPPTQTPPATPCSPPPPAPPLPKAGSGSEIFKRSTGPTIAQLSGIKLKSALAANTSLAPVTPAKGNFLQELKQAATPKDSTGRLAAIEEAMKKRKERPPIEEQSLLSDLRNRLAVVANASNGNTDEKADQDEFEDNTGEDDTDDTTSAMVSFARKN